jgi:hypothetical protein
MIFLLLNKWCISNIYLALCCSAILFFSLYLYTRKEFMFLDQLTFFFTNHFSILFYSQALIFGFLHLTNYIVDFRYFYLFPFFVISYICIGCFLGYLRVRYSCGIYLCIATHVVVNSIYSLILFH